jgi:hypothetical protein
VDEAPPQGGGKLLRFRGRPEPAADDAVFVGWHPGPFTADLVRDVGTDQSNAARASRDNVLGLGAGRTGGRVTRPGNGAQTLPVGVPGLKHLKTTLAVGATVLAVGGVSAAAYAGALPATAQGLAHSAIGAPAPQARSTDGVARFRVSPSPVSGQARRMAAAPPTLAAGPEIDAPAVYGLCLAFDRAAAKQDDAAMAKAFRNLARAAGGASYVQAYCAGTPASGTR